jgi:hypothetical protein
MNSLKEEAQEILKKLGFQITGPLLEANVLTALAFFAQRMPTLDEETKLGFFRGMDLHKDVSTDWLYGDAVVAAFRREGEALFKLFYTKAGTSPYNLGIVPGGRRFYRFQVRWSVEVLVSRASDFVYVPGSPAPPRQRTWDLPGGGGGIQFIIPKADSFLVEMPPPVAA